MEKYLRQRRRDIVPKWTEKALAAFPSDAATFLKKVKDPFSNPAGSTIATEVEFLFDALMDGLPNEEIAPRLGRIIQLCCVQDVPPSRAVSFVFKLKAIVRGELGDEVRSPDCQERLTRFESRIDELAMVAFDCFAEHRERIADIRVREARNQVATLLRMTNLSLEDPTACAPTRGGCGQ